MNQTSTIGHTRARGGKRRTIIYSRRLKVTLGHPRGGVSRMTYWSVMRPTSPLPVPPGLAGVTSRGVHSRRRFAEWLVTQLAASDLERPAGAGTGRTRRTGTARPRPCTGQPCCSGWRPSRRWSASCTTVFGRADRQIRLRRDHSSAGRPGGPAPAAAAESYRGLMGNSVAARESFTWERQHTRTRNVPVGKW